MIKGHYFGCGASQTGKTTLAIHRAHKEWQGAVVFFNPQYVCTPASWTRFDTSKHTMRQLLDLVDKGKKIDLEVSFNDKVAKQELYNLCDALLSAKLQGHIKQDVLFIVDECHVYAPNTNQHTPLDNVVSRGKISGLYCYIVTQRPARTSKSLYALADVKSFNWIESEDHNYFKGQGVPMAEIQDAIRRKSPHAFVDKHKDLNGLMDGYSHVQLITPSFKTGSKRTG